jgi:hypothetical protein
VDRRSCDVDVAAGLRTRMRALAKAGPFAKAIYPQVKHAHDRGRTIDDELMRTMAKSCVELRAALPSGALPK